MLIMKKFLPKLKNIKHNVPFLKKEFISLADIINTRKWILLTSVFSMLFVLQISAQTIENIDNFMNDGSGESLYLKNLITELHSSAYIEDGVVTTFGNGSPVILNTGTKEFSFLYNENSAFGETELIKLFDKHEDLQNKLDLTRLQGFNNLAWIYVSFSFNPCSGDSDDCLLSRVQNLFQGLDQSSVKVVYKLSIPN
jgi:hypothetical protein